MSLCLYYECPVDATYMAKNFQVRIGLYWDASGETYEAPWQEIIGMSQVINPPNLIVNPDSEDIFEPQVGDLVRRFHTYNEVNIKLNMNFVRVQANEDYYIKNDSGLGNLPNIPSNRTSIRAIKGYVEPDPECRKVIIIERDNKPFITPRRDG